jgi:hypothetical protein
MGMLTCAPPCVRGEVRVRGTSARGAGRSRVCGGRSPGRDRAHREFERLASRDSHRATRIARLASRGSLGRNADRPPAPGWAQGGGRGRTALGARRAVGRSPRVSRRRQGRDGGARGPCARVEVRAASPPPRPASRTPACGGCQTSRRAVPRSTWRATSPPAPSTSAPARTRCPHTSRRPRRPRRGTSRAAVQSAWLSGD